jgi:drug/metabolite transporter (DMT)-like permease
MRPARIRFYFLITLMVLLWCGNFIALKVCLHVMPALGVSAFRITSAAVILIFVYIYSRRQAGFRPLRRQDYSFFAKLALTGLVINQTLFVLGLSYTTVAHSALIVTFGPLFTLIFAWLRGQELLTHRKVTGMLLSVGGIVLLNFDQDFTLQTKNLLGDFFTLMGSMAFAYFTVLSKNAASTYGPVPSTCFTYFAGACMFLPIGLPLICRVNWLRLTWGSYLAFFYVAALSSVVAQLIFYYALRRMSASRLAGLAYLQPIVTTIASVVLLSERLSVNFLLGGSVVLSGIVLTQRPGSQQKKGKFDY